MRTVRLRAVAFNEALAARIRRAVAGTAGVAEKRMFGGVAFMLHGHMFVGVVDSSLMARVGPEEYQAALSRPHVREMDFTGKPMRGYVFVDPAGLRTARGLQHWTRKCARFVSTLPKKAKK
jgi:TfoX/Sxy family transcriptional regulator of competence genes